MAFGDMRVQVGDRVGVVFPVTFPARCKRTRECVFWGRVRSVDVNTNDFVVDFDDGDTYRVHSRCVWEKAPSSDPVAFVTAQNVADAKKGADVCVVNTAAAAVKAANGRSTKTRKAKQDLFDWTRLSSLSKPYLRVWTTGLNEEFAVWAKHKRTRVRVACADRGAFDALCAYLERKQRHKGLGHW